MPNWCDSRLAFKHVSESEAKRFHDLVKSWTINTMPNGFGDEWLGNICVNSGVGEWAKDKGMFDKEGHELFCRGSIFGNEIYDSYVEISQETAWAPAMRMWRLICEKHNFDCWIEFWAEEGGCELYATNDPDLEGSYEIDVFDDPPEWFGDAECVHEASLETVIEFLQKALKTDEPNLLKLRAMKEQSDDCDWFAIHEWEHSDVSDWE